MKLWQKNEKAADKAIETFTVGKDRELDLMLAPYDVLGSMAHGKMLAHIGLLAPEESLEIHHALIDIYNDISAGNFRIDEGVEDIHSQVEMLLTSKLGDAGKKIHSGRSRNDQVLLDLRLFIRAELETVVKNIQELSEQLLALSEAHKDVLLPGYTHFQVAMPSSFGLWFAAYAESLLDDLLVLQAAYQVANKNPLGSAAGYGSSFPLDRSMTTHLLGFDMLNYNVVYAQMGRGKTERIVGAALASVAASLGKLAMDVCLYMNQNFAFLTFPDRLTTGSSIMPHKKNPDVFELIRGKCNKIQSLPNEITLLTANLPSGYHRDMQILKEHFFPAFQEINDCLTMANYMLSHVQINDSRISEEKYQYLFSVEAVNQLVLDGVPFRDAYRQIGEQIDAGNFAPADSVNHTHEGSIGNLCNNDIRQAISEVYQRFPFDKVASALSSLQQR